MLEKFINNNNKKETNKIPFHKLKGRKNNGKESKKKIVLSMKFYFPIYLFFFLIPLIYFILILRTEISKICHIYESTFDFFSSALFVVFISITYVSSHIAFLSCLPHSFFHLYFLPLRGKCRHHILA